MPPTAKASKRADCTERKEGTLSLGKSNTCKTPPRSAKSKTAAKAIVKSWKRERSARPPVGSKDKTKVAAEMDAVVAARKTAPKKPRSTKKQPAKKKTKSSAGKMKASNKSSVPSSPLAPRADLPNDVVDDPLTPSKPPNPHGVLLGTRIAKTFAVPQIQPNGTTQVRDVLYLGAVTDYCPVPPGLTLESDRSRRCRLTAGGLDIGLYRVKFDDGDVEDMDPDDAYEGYLLYEEQRSYIIKEANKRRTYQRKPRKLYGQGKEVVAKDIDAPDGTEATPEAGERELKRHQNPLLSRELLVELDQERLGFWKYFKEFNDEAGVKRPELLAPLTDPEMDASPPPRDSVATGAASAHRVFRSSSSSSSSSGSNESGPRTTIPRPSQTQSKGKVFPQQISGPGGNDRMVMHFRVKSWPPSDALANAAKQAHPSSDVGGEKVFSDAPNSPKRSHTSTQSAGELSSNEVRRPQDMDDGYVTAAEFEPEDDRECSGCGETIKCGSNKTDEANNDADGKSRKRKWNLAQDGKETAISRSIRSRKNGAEREISDKCEEEDSSARAQVKHEERAARRPGVFARVWRAIFLE